MIGYNGKLGDISYRIYAALMKQSTSIYLESQDQLVGRERRGALYLNQRLMIARSDSHTAALKTVDRVAVRSVGSCNHMHSYGHCVLLLTVAGQEQAREITGGSQATPFTPGAF